MRTFPVELDLRGREALVVGSFAEMVRKIQHLLDADARVTVVTEAESAPTPALSALAGRLTLLTRRASDADLEGKVVAFLAPWSTPEDEARARRWHATAVRQGTLLCTVDRPETSTFVSPAVVEAPGLRMRFASGGRSPGLLRRVREDLEVLFSDPRFGRFVDELARRRAALPRGERAARMAEVLRGFAIEAHLRFPDWFERDE
jgi:precorrin-2 dehydrogenase/sirohydrochlorin ferrochelatase